MDKQSSFQYIKNRVIKCYYQADWLVVCFQLIPMSIDHRHGNDCHYRCVVLYPAFTEVFRQTQRVPATLMYSETCLMRTPLYHVYNETSVILSLDGILTIIGPSLRVFSKFQCRHHKEFSCFPSPTDPLLRADPIFFIWLGYILP